MTGLWPGSAPCISCYRSFSAERGLIAGATSAAVNAYRGAPAHADMELHRGVLGRQATPLNRAAIVSHNVAH